MSPRPSSASAPLVSRMVRESTLVARRKLMRVGTLALMRPVMTSTLGRCVARIEMNADGARHLRETRDGLFDVGAVEHHEVGELVDDDDDVRQRLFVFAVVEERRHGAFKELVVLVDVAHAAAGQQLEAALHLADGVAQRVGGEFGLGDDGREEVRNALVHAEFDALGIDENRAAPARAWCGRAGS